MAAVAEDEFDLYGGEDDVYPQTDQAVSGSTSFHLSVSTLTICTTVRTRRFEGSSRSYNVRGHWPRPRGGGKAAKGR
jgi:hypothetical protein